MKNKIILLIFMSRRRIIEIIRQVKEKARKYPRNSIKGLINKKVYTSDGYLLGKIAEVILEGSKIESLRIKLDKKQFLAKGIILKWDHIAGCGGIVSLKNTLESYTGSITSRSP